MKRTKKLWLTFFLALLVAALVVVGMTAAAEETPTVVARGNCGAEDDGSNLSWRLDSDGTLTISGYGRMKDYSGTMSLPIRFPSPWYGDSRIKKVVVSQYVTSVSQAAFLGCENLETAVLPESLTEVNSSAFYSCSALKHIFYAGSEAQWNEILIDNGPTLISSFDDTPFRNAEFHFNVFDWGYCGGEGDGTNLMWVFDNDGTLSISGTGAMADYDSAPTDQPPWEGFNGSIRIVVVDDGVTSIGSNTFHCLNLTSVTIPDGVTSIGRSAFYQCVNLTSVTIPDGVTSIGGQAFEECSSLTNVMIPESVTSLGGGAFAFCFNLEYVDLGNSVTSIEEGAFFQCFALADITGLNSVTSIGGQAFRYTSLSSFVIPDGVTSIGYMAFEYCDLKSVTIPDSVTSIGNSAFDNCDKLKDVFYAGSETEWKAITVGESSGSLLNANIHYNVVDWGYCGGEGDGTNIVWVLTNDGTLTFSGTGAMKIDVVHEGTPRWLDYSDLIRCGMIEDGVKTIGEAAFYGCSNLSEVTLPDSVEKIDMYAFWGCQSLKSIDLSHVTDICHYAFIDCAALKSVTLTKCSFIADAFMDCTSLSKLFLSEQIRTIYVDAFYNCPLTDIFFTGSEVQWAQGIGGAFDPSTGVITVPADSIRIHYNVVDWGYCGGEGDGTNLVWVLDNDGALTISGEGAMADFTNSEPAPWSDYFAAPDAEITVLLEAGVTQIGANAFPAAEGLKELIVLNRDCDLSALVIREPAFLRGYRPSTAEDYANEHDLMSVFMPLCETDYRHTVEVIEGVDSTCVEQGHTPGLHCVECNEDFYGCEALPLENHTWGDWVTTKQPTTETEGVRTRTCTTPGCGETETATIGKLSPTDTGNNDDKDDNDGPFGWLQKAMKGLVAWFKKLLSFFSK